jgi:hypothetical protein
MNAWRTHIANEHVVWEAICTNHPIKRGDVASILTAWDGSSVLFTLLEATPWEAPEARQKKILNSDKTWMLETRWIQNFGSLEPRSKDRDEASREFQHLPNKLPFYDEYTEFHSFYASWQHVFVIWYPSFQVNLKHGSEHRHGLYPAWAHKLQRNKAAVFHLLKFTTPM